MTRQFEEYPPEFDLNAQDLQRYGITKIWAAFHSPELRSNVYREWRSGYRSFPAWVSQQVYAQRRAKRTPSHWASGVRRRPHWRSQYANELAASPALLAALSLPHEKRLGEVFRLAGLSNQETAIFRRLCEGMEPGEITKELQMSWNTYTKTRSRALGKFKSAFATVNLFIDRPKNAPEAA